MWLFANGSVHASFVASRYTSGKSEREIVQPILVEPEWIQSGRPWRTTCVKLGIISFKLGLLTIISPPKMCKTCGNELE